MSNTFPGEEQQSYFGGARAQDSPGAGQLLVLGLDTASQARSVALMRGAELVSLKLERRREAQSLGLLSQIDEALGEACVGLRDVGLFAVAAGPGSFTGLRAGLATVKAFASATGSPIAAVPTLHAVAFCAGASQHTIAALPAGRGEVYAQLLSVGEDLRVVELSEPLHVHPANLLEMAAGWRRDVKWAGGGVHVHASLIRETAAAQGFAFEEAKSATERSSAEAGAELSACAEVLGRVRWDLAQPVESYAAVVAAMGLIRHKEGETVGAASLRAQYVRPSDAELNERG